MTVATHTDNFGSLLKFLRKRAHLTQRDLAQAVGYTEAHICRLEKNERLPDLTTVAALFIPALDIQRQPAQIEVLLKLAAQARGETRPTGVKISQITVQQQVIEELGALEEIPPAPAVYVERPAMVHQVQAALLRDRCVALCGMPGMGKTTLAAATARAHTASPVFWHTFTSGINTSVDAILRQLALFFYSLNIKQALPLIERRSDASPLPLDQQIAILRTSLTLQPALFCFEDAHLLHGNEASLSLLHHLCSTTPASLLLTSRLDGMFPLTEIRVAGLEAHEGQALIESLGVEIGPDARAGLLAKTSRNPMLLRLAAGQLAANPGETQPFIEHLETQPQVAGYLLNIVLGDLSPAAHWLATLLAIFRQPVNLYDPGLADRICRADMPGSLEQAVLELQRRRLVEDVRRGELHPLVRDHLSAALAVDAQRRNRLHRLAAEWFECSAGNPAEAAFHWMNAGDLEQAAEVIGNAGEQILGRGTFSTAVLVVEEALERARRRRGDTSGLRRRLLTAHGDLLRGTFRAADAENSYRQALALAQNLPAVRAHIVHNLALILMQRSQTAEALQLCQSALADLTAADVILRARLASILCRAELLLSRVDAAEASAREAIALAHQFSEAYPQAANEVWARAERSLGWIQYTRQPESDEALVHYRRALDCAQSAGLRAIRNAILSNIGAALTTRGDFDGAEKSLHQALDGYEAIGDMYGKAVALHNLGFMYNNRDEPEKALIYQEQAAEIERRLGDWDGLLNTEAGRASMLMGMGKVVEARDVLDRALVEAKGATDLWSLGTCYCLLAEIQLLQGETSAARAAAEHTLTLRGIEDNARLRAWARSGLALIGIADGDLASAQSALAGGAPAGLGVEMTLRWQTVQCAVALACGDTASAQAIAHEVIAIADEKGLQNTAIPARRILAEPDISIAELPQLILTG